MESLKKVEYKRDGVFCIIEKDKKFLFVKRADNGKWDLPCGGVEEGELPIDAVIREVKEETNIDLDKKELKDNQKASLIQRFTKKGNEALKKEGIKSFLPNTDENGGMTGKVDVFYTEIDDVPELKGDEEVEGFEWFTEEQILDREKKDLFTLGSVGVFYAFKQSEEEGNGKIGMLKGYIEDVEK